MAKKSTRASLLEAQRLNAALLARVGYTGKVAKYHVNVIPDYSSTNNIPTSDRIDNGLARTKHVYSGSEIAGVVLNHKSNYEPVRRDNKQAAVEAAQMRR